MTEDMQTIPSLDPTEDDFANTGRPAEDLFDDEIVPSPSHSKAPNNAGNHNGRGRGGARGRGGRGARGAPRGRGSVRGFGHSTSRASAPAGPDRTGGDGVGSGITSRHAAPAPPPAAAAAATTESASPPPSPPAVASPTAPAAVAADPPDEATQGSKMEATEDNEGGNGDETEADADADADAEAAPPSPGPEDEAETDKTPPTGPAAGITRKEFPARNRITTGGPNRQKLTEQELASRMEAVRLKNQARTEKHLRAAEDEQKFKEAEQVRKAEEVKRRVEVRRKTVEDGKKKKELDAEREQNRQRKLKALSNREWDVSKTEEDYNPSPYSSRSRRGAHGGVSGFISNPDASYSRDGAAGAAGEEQDEQYSYPSRGRGRGGRGRGRGGDRGDRGDRGYGGGGRGGRGGFRPGAENAQGSRQLAPADIKNDAEFPALPETKPKIDTASKAPVPAPETPIEPETPKGTWAEQAQAAAEKAEQTSTQTGEVVA